MCAIAISCSTIQVTSRIAARSHGSICKLDLLAFGAELTHRGEELQAAADNMIDGDEAAEMRAQGCPPRWTLRWTT
jgi:hypothetical protein